MVLRQTRICGDGGQAFTIRTAFVDNLHDPAGSDDDAIAVVEVSRIAELAIGGAAVVGSPGCGAGIPDLDDITVLIIGAGDGDVEIAQGGGGRGEIGDQTILAIRDIAAKSGRADFPRQRDGAIPRGAAKNLHALAVGDPDVVGKIADGVSPGIGTRGEPDKVRRVALGFGVEDVDVIGRCGRGARGEGRTGRGGAKEGLNRPVFTNGEFGSRELARGGELGFIHREGVAGVRLDVGDQTDHGTVQDLKDVLVVLRGGSRGRI